MDIPGPLGNMIEETRVRLQRQRRWGLWLAYCLPVSAGCLVFTIVARFVYVPYFGPILAGAIAAAVAAAAVLARRLRIDGFAAAAQLDMAEGLEERLSTTVQVSQEGRSGEVVEALFNDAERAAGSVSPATSVVFRAPRTLPLTFALAIAATAIALAPRAFGNEESGLPQDIRIALKEAVRIGTTVDLLKEGGAPESFVEQMDRLARDLRNRDLDSAVLKIERLRMAVGKNLEDAAKRDSALATMKQSDPLSRLAELLSSNAPEREVAAESTAVFRESAPEAARLLEDILEKIGTDSGIAKELKDALEALRRRDEEAFVRSMENFSREARKIPRTEALKMTRGRLEGTAARLGAKGGSLPPGVTGLKPGENGTAPTSAGNGTALEEAMEREKVPERFRGLVRTYFARPNAGQRSGK